MYQIITIMKIIYLTTFGLFVMPFWVDGDELHRNTNETCAHCDLHSNTKRLKETVQEYKTLSIIYTLADLASDNIQSAQCFNELQDIQRGINEKEIWAAKGKCLPMILAFSIFYNQNKLNLKH